MRVLHIIGDSRLGGIARIILGLGRIAHADNWHVDVLATDSAVQDVLKRQSIGIVNRDMIRREIRPLWDLWGLLRLCRFLRRERYDIVHTHTSKGGFIGRLAAWLAGVPVIVHTVHGFAFHEHSPAVTRRVYTALERLAQGWCHRIVSVSEFHARWALELGICSREKIQAIPNGLTPQDRSSPCDRAGVRRRLGIGEDEVLILSPARLAPDKGLAYLIEAAAMLRRCVPKYRVLIAGDGPIRDGLEHLTRVLNVSDSVSFLGFRDDIGDLMDACDLVVLPSFREGLSMSLLEAMAAGKPIVATSIGSNRELTSQGDVARLVPPADSWALAAAIHSLARDPARRARLAAEARSLFAARYTEDRMLNEYRQLYQSLIKRNLPNHVVASSRSQAPIVRSATDSDLRSIVSIHQRAFSHFFLTRMGAKFLRLYYGLVLRYRAGIVLVSEQRGTLTGFVCGFADPAEFYRLMWRNRRIFAPPALSALFRHPSLAANFIYGIRRIQTSAAQGPPRWCELSSIAIAPEASGNGLGKKLLREFLEHSWSKQAECVYLTTDADANEAANALYREVGFQHTRRFLQRKSRWMNEYVFHRVAVDQLTETCL
jgi:glycosyltransferase involved in cell wall biosynthesis/ribosomal protein S18 acetylase RimI-like enzyme